MFKAKNVMIPAVVCVPPDMPIYDAMRIMVNRNITGLPVVDADLLGGSQLLGPFFTFSAKVKSRNLPAQLSRIYGIASFALSRKEDFARCEQGQLFFDKCVWCFAIGKLLLAVSVVPKFFHVSLLKEGGNKRKRTNKKVFGFGLFVCLTCVFAHFFHIPQNV